MHDMTQPVVSYCYPACMCRYWCKKWFVSPIFVSQDVCPVKQDQFWINNCFHINDSRLEPDRWIKNCQSCVSVRHNLNRNVKRR